MEQNQKISSGPVIEFSPQESKYRLVADAFITPEECQPLIQLVENYGTVGDGYGGNPHPHTATEVFGGYSFNGMRNKSQKSTPGHMEALAVMKKAQQKLKSHFGLPFLWLDFGHLVFRQPTGESAAAEPEHFSHPWHFDDQVFKHRTHTAILYLNDEFDGGHTLFKETDFGPFREIQPQPGKLAAFDVAKNAHGVSKLQRGKRYVLNMWFSTHWRMLNHHRKIFGPL
jgi:hypothetical protein